MESISSAIKIFLFTALLIWMCQFRIENKSIERHFTEFVHGSSLTEPIHRIADGSRKLANDGWSEVQSLTGETKRLTNSTTRKASAFKWTWGSDDHDTKDSE